MWYHHPSVLWICNKCNQPDANKFVIEPPYQIYCDKCKQPVEEFRLSPVHESALFSQNKPAGDEGNRDVAK